jgi:hypothetical protein
LIGTWCHPLVQTSASTYKKVIIIPFLAEQPIFGASLMFNPYPAHENPIRHVEFSPLLTILACSGGIGFVVQYQNTRSFTLDSYNRWETES